MQSNTENVNKIEWPKTEDILRAIGIRNRILLDGKRAIEPNWQRWCTETRESIPSHQGNYGIPAGPANNLLFLDVDELDKFSDFLSGRRLDTPSSFCVKTGKGHHYYYRYPADGKHYGCRALRDAGFDIKGNGGYVVAPGSIHPDTGSIYEVVDDKPIADAPKWLLDLAENKREEKPAPTCGGQSYTWDGDVNRLPIKPETKNIILTGVPVGDRSEAILTALNALVWSGLSDVQIIGIMHAYPIGEKFREKQHGEKWLQPQIEKARAYVTDRAKPREDYRQQTAGDTSGSTSQHSQRREEEQSEEEPVKDPESWPVLEAEAIYGGLLSQFVSAACEHSEADPAAVLITFLARFSAEVGNRPFMYIGDGKHHGNILTAVSGTTGGGRKGTSATPVNRLFKFGSDDYFPATVTPGPLSSGEGIIFAVRDPVMQWKVDKKSGVGEWIVADPGVEDKRLFVLSEELGSAFRAMEREGNTLSTIIRQIYDSGDLAPLTKANKITATSAHIAVVGHITFFELNKLLEANEIHNGLINRFMWVCSRRQKIVPFPKPIRNDDLIRMQSLLLDVLVFTKTVTEMSFSEESKLMWSNVYPGLSKERGGVIGDILVRAPGHVLRLSMLYGLLDKTDVIYPCHIEAAMAVWSYCEKSARYIFESQSAGDPLQNKILSALGVGTKTATEISNVLGRNIPAKQISGALKSLIEQGRIEMVIEKGNGRPSKKYKALTK